MPLFSVEVEGYRAFRDKAKIDIHPLTLLYGENQAGKSTLLRLLVLLAEVNSSNKCITHQLFGLYAG